MIKTSISSEAQPQFGAVKIAFPQKPFILTDRRTDISNYANITFDIGIMS